MSSSIKASSGGVIKLMYLIDTNILLELLLDQERADEAERFLLGNSLKDFYITEFSLYSMGIIMFHRSLYSPFLDFLDDLMKQVDILDLSVQEMKDIGEAAQKFKLDFDDAYQYAVAEKHGLEIVSFDTDFDRTDRGRIPPGQAIG